MGKTTFLSVSLGREDKIYLEQASLRNQGFYISSCQRD